MKKDLNVLFDEAQPADLEPFADALTADAMPPEALARVKEKVFAGTDIGKKRIPVRRWLRLAAAAVCVCLIAGGAAVIARRIGQKPGFVDPEVDFPSDYLSINDLPDPKSIVFGGNAPLSERTQEEGPTDKTVLMNGIRIAATLSDLLASLPPDARIAVTAVRSTPPAISLDDYPTADEGRTYAEVRAGLNEAKRAAEKLTELKIFSDDYDELVRSGRMPAEEFREKFYANVDRDFALGNGYVTEGDDPFRRSLISDDLDRYTGLCNWLESVLDQAEAKYRAEFLNALDWKLLSDAGYAVCLHQGTFFAVLTVREMGAFADAVTALYPEKTVSDVSFRLVTNREPGLDDPELTHAGGVITEPDHLPQPCDEAS